MSTIQSRHAEGKETRNRYPGLKRQYLWFSPWHFYPADGADYGDLRDALESFNSMTRLHFEPETSAALGFGFRCGFLGTSPYGDNRERLEREFGA